MKKYVFLLCKVALAIIAWCCTTVVYTWLANGDLFAFLLTFVAIPFVAYGLRSVYQIDHEFFQHKIQWLVGKLFWFCVIWAFLPVIINGMSLAVGRLGFPHQGDFLFKWRFASALLIPFCLFVATVFVFFIGEFCYSWNHGRLHDWIVGCKRWCKRHLWHEHYARD